MNATATTDPRSISHRRQNTRRIDVVEIHFTIRDSPLGRMLLAARKGGLCAVMLGDEDAALTSDLRSRFPGAILHEGGPDLDAPAADLLAHLEKPTLPLELEIEPMGTRFQRTVWDALREIPAGTTETYQELARRIGRPTSARAVGAACAANPLAIIVPCHRVVRSDGGLAGYRWGVERKRRLLEREQAR